MPPPPCPRIKAGLHAMKTSQTTPSPLVVPTGYQQQQQQQQIAVLPEVKLYEFSCSDPTRVYDSAGDGNKTKKQRKKKLLNWGRFDSAALVSNNNSIIVAVRFQTIRKKSIDSTAVCHAHTKTILCFTPHTSKLRTDTSLPP